MGGIIDKPTKSLHSYLTAGDDIETPLAKGTCVHTCLQQNALKLEELKVSETQIQPVRLRKSQVTFYFNRETGHAHLTPNPLPQKIVNLRFNHGKEVEENLVFEHSPVCCAKELEDYKATLPQELKKELYTQKLIKLACCVAVIDSKGRLLIARRCNAKLFPYAWVLPGGHLERGEDMKEAALRELDQEVGIGVKQKGDKFYYHHHEVEVHAFFANQSGTRNSNPTNTDLKLGVLTSHHLILFYYVKLPVTFEHAHIKADYREISGVTWVSREQIQSIFEKEEGELPGYCYMDSKHGKEEVFNYSNLHPLYPNAKKEGISRAHVSAINVLLEKGII